VKSFIDTNILIYWVDDSARADVVEQLLAQQAVISVQVLNEFANVLRRKRAMALKWTPNLGQVFKWDTV
jgi:predicted nucleic acid-binding protein